MRDNFLKKYRIEYTLLTNKTKSEGEDDYPALPCKLDVAPDYLCLYGDVKDYCKTERTCVCFYEFDNEFDGINGLFNAIYYNNKNLLKKFKSRFENVKMIIEPDYSQIRDIESIENKYRQFRSRLVGLWFLLELHIPVIPNLTYSGEHSFSYMLDGIKESTMLAISFKGIIRKKEEINLLKKAIKYVCDNTNIKTLVCYTTGIIDSIIFDTLDYAIKKNIDIVIPNNLMRERNKILLENKKKIN